jgi:hypothetical protein
MKTYLSTLLIVGCLGLNAHAQFGDLLSRTSVKAKFDLPKKFSLGVAVQSRYNFSKTSYNRTLYTIEASYDATKWLRINGSFRHAFQSNANALIDGKALTSRYRYSGGIRLNPAVLFGFDKYIDIYLNSNFQVRVAKFVRPQYYLRNKLTLKPNLKSKIFKPYMSAESFYCFNQEFYLVGNAFITQGLMNEMRYEIGTEIDFNKRNSIELGLMLRDYQTKKNTDLVLCVTYSHTFLKKRKSKSKASQ